jgi:hypothetical protein
MMSTGAKPKEMPWRAATKPAAQHKDAPVPQRMPVISGDASAEPNEGGLGFLTKFLPANWPQRHGSMGRIVPLGMTDEGDGVFGRDVFRRSRMKGQVASLPL